MCVKLQERRKDAHELQRKIEDRVNKQKLSADPSTSEEFMKRLHLENAVCFSYELKE